MRRMRLVTIYTRALVSIPRFAVRFDSVYIAFLLQNSTYVFQPILVATATETLIETQIVLKRPASKIVITCDQAQTQVSLFTWCILIVILSITLSRIFCLHAKTLRNLSILHQSRYASTSLVQHRSPDPRDSFVSSCSMKVTLRLALALCTARPNNRKRLLQPRSASNIRNQPSIAWNRISHSSSMYIKVVLTLPCTDPAARSDLTFACSIIWLCWHPGSARVSSGSGTCLSGSKDFAWHLLYCPVSTGRGTGRSVATPRAWA